MPDFCKQGLGILMALFLFPLAAMAEAESKQPPQHDPVIIQYDLIQDASARPAGQSLLTIYQSGLVRFLQQAASGQRTAQIDPDRLSSLIRHITDTDSFYALRQSRINDAIQTARQKAGPFLNIADGGVSHITLHTGQDSNHISLTGLQITARQYPDIEDLQHLARTERRLQELLTVLRKTQN